MYNSIVVGRNCSFVNRVLFHLLLFLGMSHDGKRTGKTGRNSCPTQGFIMSPSRGTKGETLWSRCSAKIIRELDMPCLEEGIRMRCYIEMWPTIMK